MPKTKTLTVVITAYNYARYLDECIQSVLDQSVKADEIIVVDDESTDNTREIVAKYPVKYIWQRNKGLSGARNTGIRAATSEYIMSLDADDMLRPDAIKEHMKLTAPDAVAQCGLMYFGSQIATFRPQGANLQSLLKTNSVYCNSVFPKKAWIEVGGYDESPTMRLGLEDWLFWIECAVKGYKFNTGDYIALLYRRHEGAMTQATTHPRWNEITAYMKTKVKEKYGLDSNFHSIDR